MDAVLRLNGGTNLEAIHVLKKPGGNLEARRLCQRTKPAGFRAGL